MVNMSAKFDQEAQNALVAIVFTSLFRFSRYRVHKLISIYVHGDLDL